MVPGLNPLKYMSAWVYENSVKEIKGVLFILFFYYYFILLLFFFLFCFPYGSSL